jgi:hypothetical protein
MTKINAAELGTSYSQSRDWEDGSVIETAHNYVEARTAHGEVYAHVASFGLTDRQRWDLLDRVRAAGEIDLDHWDFVRVVYGSEAYLEEEGDAHMYAQGIRSGAWHIEDVPENLRSML